MSKLLKKLKSGVRIIDIESGVEGYVSYDRDIVPNSITVEFEPSVVMSSRNLGVAAISYPISVIENRVKLAPKYGNYKIGDRVKDISSGFNKGYESFVENIVDGVVLVNRGFGISAYTLNGRGIANTESAKVMDEIVLKRLKVKKPK